jgi:hypothetical protein
MILREIKEQGRIVYADDQIFGLKLDKKNALL